MKNRFPLFLLGFLLPLCGFGQFLPTRPLHPSLELNVEFSDLDADGFPDLLGYSTEDHRPIWQPSAGTAGYFRAPQLLRGLPAVAYVTAAELNGDGLPDLIFLTDESQLGYAIQVTAGRFDRPVLLTDPPFSACDGWLDAADLNGDGLDEIFHRNCSGVLGVYRNLGSLDGFSSFQSIASLDAFDVFRVVDLDVDGDPDLALQRGDALVAYRNFDGFLNTGTDTLTLLGFNDHPRFADLNGDALPELVYSGTQPGIFQRINQGNFSFGPELPIPLLDHSSVEYDLGDLDGDGDVDILAHHFIDDLIWLRNNGSGSFSPLPGFTQPLGFSNPDDLQLVDLDQDGAAEVFVRSFGSAPTMGYFRNEDGMGLSPIFPLGGHIGDRVRLGHLNADSIPDVVFGSSAGLDNIFWRTGETTRGYGLGITFPVHHNGDLAAVIDLNNDGLDDVLYRSFENGEQRLRVALSDGQGGTLADPYPVGTNDLFVYVAHGDVDQDGNTDLLVADFSLIENIYLIRNFGTGTFGAPEYVGTQDINRGAEVDDLYGDGFPELVIQSGTASVTIFDNATGAFGASQSIAYPEVTADRFQVADRDGDGDLELFYEQNDQIYYRENTGTTLSSAATLWQLPAGEAVRKFRVMDASGDQRVDLLAQSANTGTIQVYAQQPDESLVLVHETQPITLNHDLLTALDVDLDGDLDLLTQWYDELIIAESTASNPTLSGTVYLDANQNGTFDTAEIALLNQPVHLDPEAPVQFSSATGQFSFPVRLSDYTISVIPTAGWQSVTDSTIDLTISQPLDTTVVNFGLFPDGDPSALAATATSGPTRCGFSVPFWLTVENRGVATADGQLVVQFDTLLYDGGVQFDAVTPPPSSVNGGLVTWTFDTLLPSRTLDVHFDLTLPGPDFIGDTLDLDVHFVRLDSSGDTLFRDSLHFASEINCAYDPNDKLTEPNYPDYENYILPGDSVIYTIRFQNTGTDTAFTVRLEDRLSAFYEYGSLRMLAASHPYNYTLDPTDGLLTVQFDQILLPPQSQDNAGSQGFIKFRVDLRDGVPVPHRLRNSADIFFDFNPPIRTNDAENLLVDQYPVFFAVRAVDCSGGGNGSVGVVFPYGNLHYLWNNGDTTATATQLPAGTASVTITRPNGRIVATGSTEVPSEPDFEFGFTVEDSASDQATGSATVEVAGAVPPLTYAWNVDPPQTGATATGLAPGIYTVTVTDANGCSQSAQVIVGTSTSTAAPNRSDDLRLQPNPFRGVVWLHSTVPVEEVRLYDARGQLYWSKRPLHSIRVLQLPVEQLPSGVYWVEVQTAAGKVRTLQGIKFH